MRLQDTLFKICIGVSLSLGLFTPALASDDYNCTQLMYEHGLATSAQMNCGYDTYSKAIIEDAGKCMALANKFSKETQLENALKEGMSDFQTQYNEADDKKRICADFADEFSFIVRP
ncbi:MAG: hypothetical protein V7689_10795 [Psychrobacter sp.]|tara:strand:+ start:11983 stop:12333 length:351 start_codon:yes stop_codon:yes gene_type:complete